MNEKLVAHGHLKILHEGVGYTMTEVRGRFWISKLHQITKHMIYKCYGCKRFRTVACPAPAVGDLILDSIQLLVIDINFAGPLIYTKKRKQEVKPLILLWYFSLTRSVFIDLMIDQSLEKFLTTQQRFIARRGRSEKVYSDNFLTFAAASKWFKEIL